MRLDLPKLRLSPWEFGALPEYSASYPTGTVPGKRWKRLDGSHDHYFLARGGNPVHIEPVPKRVNILSGQGRAAKQARQTHCKRGHALSGRNLYFAPAGRRVCRACNVLHSRNARARGRQP